MTDGLSEGNNWEKRERFFKTLHIDEGDQLERYKSLSRNEEFALIVQAELFLRKKKFCSAKTLADHLGITGQKAKRVFGQLGWAMYNTRVWERGK